MAHLPQARDLSTMKERMLCTWRVAFWRRLGANELSPQIRKAHGVLSFASARPQLNLFFRYAPIAGASGFTSGPK